MRTAAFVCVSGDINWACATFDFLTLWSHHDRTGEDPNTKEPNEVSWDVVVTSYTAKHQCMIFLEHARSL